jgi:hypothetical protein
VLGSCHHHHQQQQHHVAIKDLGQLLTYSGLTHPEVSSVVFLGLGSCEHGNEISSYIMGWKFHDQLSNCLHHAVRYGCCTE